VLARAVLKKWQNCRSFWFVFELPCGGFCLMIAITGTSNMEWMCPATIGLELRCPGFEARQLSRVRPETGTEF
jgi:hypothetical protein